MRCPRHYNGRQCVRVNRGKYSNAAPRIGRPQGRPRTPRPWLKCGRSTRPVCSVPYPDTSPSVIPTQEGSRPRWIRRSRYPLASWRVPSIARFGMTVDRSTCSVSSLLGRNHACGGAHPRLRCVRSIATTAAQPSRQPTNAADRDKRRHIGQCSAFHIPVTTRRSAMKRSNEQTRRPGRTQSCHNNEALAIPSPSPGWTAFSHTLTMAAR